MGIFFMIADFSGPKDPACVLFNKTTTELKQNKLIV